MEVLIFLLGEMKEIGWLEVVGCGKHPRRGYQGGPWRMTFLFKGVSGEIKQSKESH
jgi:hypothetical protein